MNEYATVKKYTYIDTEIHTYLKFEIIVDIETQTNSYLSFISMTEFYFSLRGTLRLAIILGRKITQKLK